MGFDLSTAEPVDSGSFDLSSAKPVEESGFSKAYRIMKGVLGATPQGMAFRGVNMGMEALDKAAYAAGGKVTDVTGSPALGTATNVAMQAAPMVLGGGVGAQVGKLAGEGLAPRLMQSALKPTWEVLDAGKGQRAVKTMLEDGRLVGHGGVGNLKTDIGDLKGQSNALVANATGDVGVGSINQKLADLLKEYGASSTPSADHAAIKGVQDEFLAHPYLGGGDSMSVQLAQAMKERNYKKLGDAAYGSGLKPAAERDAIKTITTGLREGVEGVAPEVGPINSKTSDLINAKNIAERAVLMNDNKHPLGIGVLNLATLPLALWDRNPWAKSLAAQGLYHGGAPTGAAAGATAGNPHVNALIQAMIDKEVQRRAQQQGAQ